MPLFPELRRFSTVEERQAQQDEASRELLNRLRNHEAKQWREARRRVRWLTDYDLETIAELWNARFLPNDPVYLLDLIRQHRDPLFE